MTIYSHQPMQKALYQQLTGNAPLMALVTGIYDRIPQGTPMPYIVLGDATLHDRSTKTSGGTEQLLTLRVWSREGGRKQAATIMEKVHSLLHEADILVEGQNLISIRFVSSAITLENDGYTYQGQMQFRALLEPSGV